MLSGSRNNSSNEKSKPLSIKLFATFNSNTVSIDKNIDKLSKTALNYYSPSRVRKPPCKRSEAPPLRPLTIQSFEGGKSETMKTRDYRAFSSEATRLTKALCQLNKDSEDMSISESPAKVVSVRRIFQRDQQDPGIRNRPVRPHTMELGKDSTFRSPLKHTFKHKSLSANRQSPSREKDLLSIAQPPLKTLLTAITKNSKYCCY